MARKAGIEWKAVGASLNDLAATMRKLPANTPGAFAYASSGVMQQAGVVMAARYITDSNYMDARGNYTAPPNGTHGPIKRTNRNPDGTYRRNERGQYVYADEMQKLFVKGQFVSRSGAMREIAKELAGTAPTSSLGVTLAHGMSRIKGSDGEIDATIDASGRGHIAISGGYRAAEVGSRKTGMRGIKGWWRALRSVQGRYATLLRKKYPDLLRPVVGLGK